MWVLLRLANLSYGEKKNEKEFCISILIKRIYSVKNNNKINIDTNIYSKIIVILVSANCKYFQNCFIKEPQTT